MKRDLNKPSTWYIKVNPYRIKIGDVYGCWTAPGFIWTVIKIAYDKKFNRHYVIGATTGDGMYNPPREDWHDFSYLKGFHRHPKRFKRCYTE